MASAANAAADEARPTPFGTPLVVRMLARASIPASDRTRSTKRSTREASSVGAASPSIVHSSAAKGPKAQVASTQKSVEGQRNASGRREVEGRVALAPVLDQRDVDVGTGGGFCAGHRRALWF